MYRLYFCYVVRNCNWNYIDTLNKSIFSNFWYSFWQIKCNILTFRKSTIPNLYKPIHGVLKAPFFHTLKKPHLNYCNTFRYININQFVTVGKTVRWYFLNCSWEFYRNQFFSILKCIQRDYICTILVIKQQPYIQ